MSVDRDELLGYLRSGVVEVLFTKSDGSERRMRCTLQEGRRGVVVPYEAKTVRKKELNEDVVAVWDVEKVGWRSFKVSSVKSIELCDEVLNGC